ncbi:hypothetical protein [Microbacterium sp. Leaf320]|uniref:hypothetical protein n=1 Tax=Microbacterium sp. Leaf320 TaxID=1736334 RepID=UPI0006F25CDA|nr:hypothetical protein [Microbacterium sp. Leaf320]KQQ65340.1 hypothetical protein ASF63_15475 [Microbacterium sp. Leaf320]
MSDYADTLTDESIGVLRARVSMLETENERLRTALTPPVSPARRGAGWRVASAVLVIIGLLAGLAGLVTAYARTQLLTTEQFVGTFAPLADDPAIQDVLVEASLTAINDAVDVPGLTTELIDGIRTLDLPPRADSALNLLKGPAAQGAQSLIDSSVNTIVRSDAFASTWENALQVTHTQLLATMRGEEDAALSITDGTLSVQLGPVVEQVRTRLLDAGIGLADAIPTIDRSIPLLENTSLDQIRGAYYLIDIAGAWLPWVSLVLLTAGVMCARRRRRAVAVTAAMTAVTMLILTVGLALARTIVTVSVSGAKTAMTPDAAQSLFDAATENLSSMIVALTTLAITVFLVAWLSGPASLPTKLRATVTAAGVQTRERLEARGLHAGRVGAWVSAHTTVIVALIAVAGAAVILLTRPLSPAVIIWTVVGAAVIAVSITFVPRPPVAVPSDVFGTEDAAE